ncbi:aldose 1-epimerase [Rahnella woolbedingensis]|uniref:Aldose 1-epimerase n=1 Tax=Rahnella woolbedingensis TaxID=1510574 RepID=A0A419ND00_9GAMM|nr:aldose 1-epimerase [Rahnella woolbedingensis]RJT46339.1 aldose 1-epimerase [Rahnella woolbedingensis]
MSLFTLAGSKLSLIVSTHGGSIVKLVAHHPEGDQPLLRPAVVAPETPPLESCCFPLVPFGNRVNGNTFEFDGISYPLVPNTGWDAHYLHGDGWLNEWHCPEHSARHVLLEYVHTQGAYQYHARQFFELDDNKITVTLSVTNLAQKEMPFGLGWHPYFPLAADTLLQANANGYWQEGAQWLAGEHDTNIPADLCFATAQPLPRRWVNNGFSGWDGRAKITWPQHQQQLLLTTEPACPVCFIFVSDPVFDPGYDFDFFCFEPMSHAANAHNMPDLGGLKVLQPQQTLTQCMTLSAQTLT